MRKLWRRSVAFPLAGVAVLLVVGPWTHAQVDAVWGDRRALAEREAAGRARVAEARRLADAILDQREALIERSFGPGYRETVRRALQEVPLDVLRQVESDGGEGDLRAAIAAARTPGAADSEPADDLLPLPAQFTEPSAVSGVATSGSVFVPLTPCRIVDTRLAAEGALVPGTARSFVVGGSNPALFTAQGGNSSGCGVPLGKAVAAFINFVAVSPTGPGNLRTWAYASSLPPAPFAATLNYALVPGSLNIANGVTAPLCDPLATSCTYDILAQAFGSETHVVADVLGYFRLLPTSFATISRTFSTATVGGACTAYPGGLVFVDAPGPGKVLVQTTIQLRFDHTVGVLDTVVVGIGTSPTDCSSPDAVMVRMFPEPTGFYYPTATPSRLFTVPAAGSYFFYVTAFASGSPNDAFWQGKTQATYHPE
jgi:hypothetical protein